MYSTRQSFVRHFERYLSTTVGRDKLLRLTQHFSRLCAWILLLKGGSKRNRSIAARLSILISQIVLARKLLRVGTTVTQVRSASAATRTKGISPLIRFATVGRHLALAGYSALDLAALLDSLGVYKWNKAKTIRKESIRSWWIAIIMNIVIQAHTLRTLQCLTSEDHEIEVDGGKRVSRKRSAAKIQLLSDLCDLALSSSSLGFMTLNNGIVGACGTTSSVVGVYKQWNATAQRA